MWRTGQYTKDEELLRCNGRWETRNQAVREVMREENSNDKAIPSYWTRRCMSRDYQKIIGICHEVDHCRVSFHGVFQ